MKAKKMSPGQRAALLGWLTRWVKKTRSEYGQYMYYEAAERSYNAAAANRHRKAYQAAEQRVVALLEQLDLTLPEGWIYSKQTAAEMFGKATS